MIGWHQEIEKLDREDALAFYRRFYAPNNAMLVIAGDVDAKEVRPLVEQTFGKVAAAAFDPGATHPPAGAGAGRAAHGDAGRSRMSSSPSVKRYYLVPSATTAAAGESPALDVLAQLMGSGSNSYLYRALVVDKPLAVTASAGYQGTALDRDAVLDLGLAASPASSSRSRAGGRRRDRRYRAEPDPRRGSRAGQDPAHRGSDLRPGQPGDAGALVWRRAHHGPSIEDIRSWPDRIRAVTAEQVRAAAQKWLDKKRSVTGYLIKDTTPKREEKRS